MGLLATPQVAHAQLAPDRAADSVAVQAARDTVGLGCVRALPPSALHRVPVFVYAEVADSLDRAARPAVDLVAQAVARRVRDVLSGGPAATPAADAARPLPPSDSLFGAPALAGGVRVVVRRSGEVTWQPTVPPGRPARDSAAALLLVRVLPAARDAGELFLPNELVRGDSLVYVLEHAYPTPTAPGGPFDPVTRRNPAPLFGALVPWERPAGLNGGLWLAYPDAMIRGGFGGTVVLEFLVDTAGRADPATLRDAHPETVARLAPKLRDAYARFAAAARSGVLGARFTPARVGGCVVPQRVQQPVTFALNE